VIFISYRRDDAQGEAGRLSDSLGKAFGESSIFLDVEGIQPGHDFRQVLEARIATCTVLLALIGPDWLQSTDASGQRRLDDPHDFVRLEIATALRRGIPVVPVLVRQARMVSSEALPADLSALAFRQAVELSHSRWDADVAGLVRSLRAHQQPSRPTFWWKVGAGVALAVAAAFSFPSGLRLLGSTSSTQAPASPDHGVSPQSTHPLWPELKKLGFGTSTEEISQWLGNTSTPYPALGKSLLRLLAGRKIKGVPPDLTVVAYRYDEMVGQPSPRSEDQVSEPALLAAVVYAYNQKNRPAATAIDEILEPVPARIFSPRGRMAH
jgi:hypothetical protein